MPTWGEVEKFVTNVGLPTALVLGFFAAVVWYVLRPLSENFFGRDGWVARWFSESITASVAVREAIIRLTELYAGLQAGQNDIAKTQSQHTKNFEALADEMAFYRRGGHGDDNCRPRHQP